MTGSLAGGMARGYGRGMAEPLTWACLQSSSDKGVVFSRAMLLHALLCMLCFALCTPACTSCTCRPSPTYTWKCTRVNSTNYCFVKQHSALHACVPYSARLPCQHWTVGSISRLQSHVETRISLSQCIMSCLSKHACCVGGTPHVHGGATRCCSSVHSYQKLLLMIANQHSLHESLCVGVKLTKSKRECRAKQGC